MAIAMAAPLGNKFRQKFKTPEIRQEAYKQYCEHIAKGFPKEAFHFKHPTEPVCYKTLEKYIKENPEEFPSILMEEAKADRFKMWFEEGWALVKGLYKRGSPVVWQTIMRNIGKEIGWDQVEERDRQPESLQHFKDVMSVIGQRQCQDALTTVTVASPTDQK